MRRWRIVCVLLLACLAVPAWCPPARAAKESSGAPREQRMPVMEGRTLEGEAFSTASLQGRRLVVFFFNPELPPSDLVARALARFVPLRRSQNFEIVGVASGLRAATARRFAKERGLDFPIFDDSRGRLIERIGVPVPVAVVLADAEGFALSGLLSFPEDPEALADAVAGHLRTQLRLPDPPAAGVDSVRRPLAPSFVARRLEGGEPLALESLRGKPVLLVFFLHDCPYCQSALLALKSALATLPEPKRPELLGVEISGQTASIRPVLAKAGLDFFPVLLDADWGIRNAYGIFAEVPVIVMIDPEGGILFRTKPGWDAARDPAVVRTWLARLAGAPVPMLLQPAGYTGSDICGACHEREHDTWQLTAHASAFDTLVAHGADRNTECVGCHVVGYEKEGGYSFLESRGHAPVDLEDVGCEACHGRGGPHLSPAFVKDGNYEPVCSGCHDKKHSLGFDYASFAPRISHAALGSLDAEQREMLRARIGTPREVLPTAAHFVGSDACQSCHRAEFATWKTQPHARAGHTLEQKDQASNADCLRCHTTGFGRAGGFLPDRSTNAQPDLARVGCESCHGPGGDHVADGARRIGSIVSLGDKCDSCVILQICGACHDDVNDPGFAFQVEQKIDAQRHGTIEPGTGKPLTPPRAAEGPAGASASR